MCILRFVAFALTLAVAPSSIEAQPREITRDQARLLVRAVLASQGFDLNSPSLVIDDQPDKPEFPEYYLFSAYTRGEGMDFSAGAYAVSRRTADVWNWMHCWRFRRAKRLHVLQKQLRKEIGLSESDYRKLSAERPFCFSIPVTDR